MKEFFWGILPVLLMLASCGMKETPFITVKDNNFYIGEQEYHYLGTNMWYGPLLGMATEPGDRERLIKELDFLKANGVDNLRVMGASEATRFNNTVRPAFQKSPEEYNEDVFVGMDFLLTEMAKRDMKAVIYLGNFWIWSGGFSQTVGWATGEDNPNPFLENSTWHDFMNYSARMYRNDKAQEYYYNYIKNIVNRKNTITGIQYKDDPTIMSWQLANEPRPGEGDEGRENFEVFLQWVEKSADFIKSIDANHMVSTGNEGLAGCMFDEDLFVKLNKIKNVDFVTAHLWILNWGWFDPLNAEETFPTAKQKATDYLNKHIELCKNINKPLVIEEFGIPRDGHSYATEATTEYRDKYYEMIFDLIYTDAKNGGPMAGSNFWAFGGYGKPGNPDENESKWYDGDDFTGDPPQEPQGRNAVFSSDNSTVEILKKYAAKMHLLK